MPVYEPETLPEDCQNALFSLIGMKRNEYGETASLTRTEWRDSLVIITTDRRLVLSAILAGDMHYMEFEAGDVLVRECNIFDEVPHQLFNQAQKDTAALVTEAFTIVDLHQRKKPTRPFEPPQLRASPQSKRGIS